MTLSNQIKNGFQFGIIATTLVFSSSSFAALMTPEELGMSPQIAAAPYAMSQAGLAKAAASASPEQLARAFLSREAKKIGLSADLSDLALASVQESPGGTTVRFDQMIQGMKVDSADVVVTINQGAVVSFISNYAQSSNAIDNKSGSAKVVNPSLSKEWALQKAYEELNLTASPTSQTIDQRVAVVDGQVRPAYFITLAAPVDHKYGWEFVIDADSGKVIRSRDMVFKADKKKFSPIKAVAFDPNPTIQTNHAYGTVSGYTDNNHGDTAFYSPLYTTVTLDNLTTKNGKTTLVGPYAQMAEIESPTNPDCDVDSANTSWSYTRSNGCFTAVNAYYFIDKTLRYLNGTLGFNAHPLAYQGGLKFDPHGVDGDDNSHYVATSDYLAYGDGGVPDAQDHDVVIHELGHAIHNWLTNGHLSQVEGLSEGIGDYWAASYDRQFTKPNDVARNWTFSYDGHNEFWDGRSVNVSGTYPDATQGANAEIHTAGQLWATVCIEIYDAIGKQKADKAFWSGIAMLSDNSSQNDAAKAYVAAARKLYAGDSNLINTVIAKFKARGFSVN